MKYSYTATPATNTKGRLTKRPFLPIQLFGRNGVINAVGLIDSGADTTLVNLEYAQVLGIPLDSAKQKDFLGISGERTSCFLAEIQLKVQHFDEPITTPVGFIDSPSVDVLLGQEDFFELFHVKFEKDHDVFELSRAPRTHKR